MSNLINSSDTATVSPSAAESDSSVWWEALRQEETASIKWEIPPATKKITKRKAVNHNNSTEATKKSRSSTSRNSNGATGCTLERDWSSTGTQHSTQSTPDRCRLPLNDLTITELQFINYVRQRCVEPSKWNGFISLLAALDENVLPFDTILYEFSALLSDKPDILLCFNAFLPESFNIEVSKPFQAISEVIQYASPSLLIEFNALVKNAMDENRTLEVFLADIDTLFSELPLISEVIRHLYYTHSINSKHSNDSALLAKFLSVPSSYNRFTVSPYEPMQFHRIFQLCYIFANKRIAMLYIELCKQCMLNIITYEEVCMCMDRYWPCVGELVTQNKLQEIKGLLSDALAGVTAVLPNVALLRRDWVFKDFTNVFLRIVGDCSPLLRAEIDGMVEFGRRNGIQKSSILDAILKTLKPYDQLSFLFKRLLRYVCRQKRKAFKRDSMEAVSASKANSEAAPHYIASDAETCRAEFRPRKQKDSDENENLLFSILSRTVSEMTSEFPQLAWMKESARFSVLKLLYAHTKDLNCFNEFLTVLYEYSEGLLSINEAITLSANFLELDRSPNGAALKNKLRYLLEYKLDDRNLWHVLSVSQQDTSNWNKIGATYKQIPSNFPFPDSSREKQFANILNKEYAALPDEVDAYTSEASTINTKNSIAQILFDVEDERFNWDVKMGRMKMLRNLIEDISVEIHKIDDLEKRKRAIIRPSSFSALHRKSLAEIYGDDLVQVLFELSCNPCKALPIVHSTIIYKMQQWRMLLSRLERNWRDREKLAYLLPTGDTVKYQT